MNAGRCQLCDQMGRPSRPVFNRFEETSEGFLCLYFVCEVCGCDYRLAWYPGWTEPDFHTPDDNGRYPVLSHQAPAERAEVGFKGRLRWLVFTTYKGIEIAALDAAFLLLTDAADYAAQTLADGPDELAVTIVQAADGLALGSLREAA